MALVKHFQFEIEEKISKVLKKIVRTSKLTAVEMVEKAILDGDGNIKAIWASRRDASESFQASTGCTVYPKNGVPTGQVWLFLEQEVNI